MKIDGRLFDTLDALDRHGWEEAEVFAKSGRSRTLHLSLAHPVTSLRQEEGWSVRAGDRRKSFFYASQGKPDPDAPWPDADGHGLRLPNAKPIPQWTPPSSLDAPLVGEAEAMALFDGLARELDTELPGARILSGHLDDGSSESQLVSRRDTAAIYRHRVAALRVEAVAPSRGRGDTPPQVHVTMVAKDARRLNPRAIARRLADRLLISLRGEAPHRDRGDFLLAPDVFVPLLATLEPLWMGTEADALASSLTDLAGRLGSRALTLVDDGRLPGGILEAPTDGEGQPSRRTVLIEEGVYRQPLLTWWQTQGRPSLASGCCHRPSWRDLPMQGPSHLYLEPNDNVGVAQMVSDVGRGYYLLSCDGAPRIDFETRRFSLPVSGFAITKGQPTGSVSGAWLVGSLPVLLSGIQAKARDLTFFMAKVGLLGAPTVLMRGLELRSRR